MPVVDADGMGRAFPEVPQVTMDAGRDLAEPGRDDRRARQRGHLRADHGDWMERLERAAAVEFGGSASSAEYLMTRGGGAHGATVRGTVSLAMRDRRGARGAPRATRWRR